MRRVFVSLCQRWRYQWRAGRRAAVPWRRLDQKLRTEFRDTTRSDEERYSFLFSYLITGLHHYSSEDHAYVYYQGASSRHTAEVDALEGFCRILPMIAAWLASGRPAVIQSLTGEQIDLSGFIKTGLLAGTDPSTRSFWGHIGDLDQRIVEAADVALAIWLLRDRLWSQLTPAEQQRICHWLAEAVEARTRDSNWHLFPVLISRVLASLGYPTNDALAARHYARFKSFYVGDGWFSDGPGNWFDYYNAWGIHYALFWINQVDPQFDPVFLDASLGDFVRGYKYFFSPVGFPVMGRSICYRMAAPAPLVTAAVQGVGGISPGLARRALNCVWEYFIARGALCRGGITQGYWGEDRRLIDNYSGPGSSLWSTRSLTLAFYHLPQASFWTAPEEPLPVETHDYLLSIPAIGWKIRGCKASAEVQIIKSRNTAPRPQTRYSVFLLHTFMIWVYGLPIRRPRTFGPYERDTYSNLHPFWQV